MSKADATLPFEFQTFADGYVAANQKTWGHDRTKSLGSSEAFGCLRKAWYKKNGTEADADYVQSYGAMERGNLIEDHWFVPIMRHAAHQYPQARLLAAGAKQTTLIDDDLSSTPDGVMVGLPRDCLAHRGIPDIGQDEGGPEGTGCLMVEAKSIDPRVNLVEEKTIHHGQVQIQMGLVNECTPHTPNYALIIYTDASWLDQNEQYVIEFDPAQYKYAQERAQTVFKTGKATDLVPEGRITGDCRYCEFVNTCRTDTKGVVPTEDRSGDMEAEEAAELEELVRKERNLAYEKKQAEIEHKTAVEEVKHWLEDTGHKKGRGDDWSVSYTWVNGRKSISKELLEEAGLNPEDFMTEGNGYTKITVRTS